MQKKIYIIVTCLLATAILVSILSGCNQPAGSDPQPTIAITPIGEANDVAETDESVGGPTEQPTVSPLTQVSPLFSPPTTPLPPLVVEEGAAGIQGYIGYREKDAFGVMIVWLCPFTPNSTGIDGIYILDPSVHDNAEIGDDGYFQAGYIEPGKYVLVVGAEPETARPIVDLERPGHTKVFDLVEGEILDIAVDSSLLTISVE